MKDTITLKEMTEKLGITKSGTCQAVKKNNIGKIRPGIYSKKDFEKYMETRDTRTFAGRRPRIKESRILQSYCELVTEGCFYPSLREIASQIPMSFSGLRNRLNNLVKEGKWKKTKSSGGATFIPKQIAIVIEECAHEILRETKKT